MSSADDQMITPRQPRGRDRRRPKEQTRLALLETAQALLLERGYPKGIPVRLAEVVERAGHTTGAAYQIWDNQQQFQEDLARHLAEQFQWMPPSRSLGGDQPAGSDASLHDAVATAGRRFFESFVSREDFYATLPLRSARDLDPELRRTIARCYDAVHDDLVGALGGLLKVHGRQIRSPFTLDDLAVAATGITEGLALRHRIQPGRIRTEIKLDDRAWHLYSTMLVALLEHYTTPDTHQSG